MYNQKICAREKLPLDKNHKNATTTNKSNNCQELPKKMNTKDKIDEDKIDYEKVLD